MNAEALHAALVSTGRIKSLRRLTYRCHARRCLLLEAVDTPEGVLVHQKRYKLSPTVNEATSTAEGRAANTEDGRNHWRAQTYWLSTSALRWDDLPQAGQSLECDHVLSHLLTAPQFTADWEAGHSDIRVRGDGSRAVLD